MGRCQIIRVILSGLSAHEVRPRGEQIIRNSRGTHLQRVADVLHCIADEDQCGRGALRMAKVPIRGKRVKNADSIGKASVPRNCHLWTLQT